MARKLLPIRGKQVQIDDADIRQSTPAKMVTATVGSTMVEGIITFGAEDGPRPAVSLIQVQADLDAFRQKMADEAAWREELKQALGQVV